MEESRFRSLAESERFGVVVADFAGNLLDFNDAFLRLAGYGREELRRGTVGWRELTPPEYWRRDELAIEEMRRTGACSPYEKELVNPDGRRVPVLLTGSLVDEKAGTCVDIVVDLSGRKRVESALQESRERLQFALDAARLVAWDWDVETGRMHWSDNAREVLGLPPGATLETALAMVHSEDRAAVERLVERALQGEAEYAAEYRLVRANGVIWVYDRGAVIRNSEGRPVRMTGVCQDVTERRRATEENELLLARERAARARAEAAEQRAAFLAEAGEVLASSLDDRATLRALARLAVPRVADYCVLLEVGPGNRITPVAFEHVDPGKESFLERVGELYRVRSDDPRSLVGAILGTGRSEIVGYPTLVEWEQEMPEDPELREIFGQLHPVSGMLLPLAVRGEIVGLLVLALSESGRRFDDADLELGVELARRAALAIDNARLYQEARAANTAKDRFLATLSHELRTPLAPVLASVSALEREERIEPRLRDVLSMVRRNVELEARLIDDLLDVTRAVHGKMILSRDVCDLHRVLGQALETSCSPVLRAQRQIITELAAERHRLRGDARRLTQVFLNLLQNAIKFTPAGGTIAVRSRDEVGPDGAWLVVEVEDSGMGIEPDLLPRVFEPFEQGPARHAGGLGLGLSISKTLVEMHGGRLTAASEGWGRGALFTVRLPLPEAEELEAEAAAMPVEAVAAPASSGEPARPLRILLVEDHPDTAAALADLLRAGGHQVLVRGTVAEGKAAADEVYGAGGGFDLLLSDLGLPDGTGLELMRELRGRYALPGIALSGYGMDEDLQASREAGFSRHLVKPVDLSTLMSAIREVAAANT